MRTAGNLPGCRSGTSIVQPLGVAVDAMRIYVASFNASRGGLAIFDLGLRQQPAPKVRAPRGVAVAGNGLYVACPDGVFAYRLR